jgi:SAM-dependent methyltransferase
MNKPLIVIAGKDISMCMPESKFKQLAAISYFEQTVYGTRVASVPLTLASAVLLSNDEYKHSLETLHSLGLPAHNDLPKNWDTLAALSQIINHPLVRKKSPILDAGGEYYSVFLHHLALLGFTDLYCVNLAFTEQQKKNGIRYSPGDITKTLFPDNFFAAIACLSVIEHGVDPGSFFSEMNRIIMPGGILFISVDYWQTKIKTEGKISYGAPIKIFCRDEINDIIKIAQKYDFALAEPINLRCRQKVVQCDGFKYTFLYLTFIKQLN